MKKIIDEKFKAELEEIRPLLPKKYMSVINYLYPGKFTPINIYNVLHHGVENKVVLEALKKAFLPQFEGLEKNL